MSRRAISPQSLDRAAAARARCFIWAPACFRRAPGVSGIGGAQEAAARWVAAKGGLDPRADIKVAQVGNPAALQAALENKWIDAFVLSPPEGYLAAKAKTGAVLVSLGDDFPLLSKQPFLVLVAKKPIDDKASDLILRTAKAMQAASAAVVAKPEETALAIQKQFFVRADPDAIIAAIKGMTNGVTDGGRLEAQSIENLLTFSREVGVNFGKDFDAKSSENDFWTNQFVERAGAK
jgi:ABC-type nitrate/sulfonate/bicarbonate transport system substrate-binding protein